MPDRVQTAKEAAVGLRRFSTTAADTRVMVGFDGFVDSIIQVVDKRTGVDAYEPIATIDQFGGRVSAAAGKSSNFELVTTLEKLGGNGPIMANALAAAGLGVTYIGALGYPELHPVFVDFARQASVHSVANPGFTDCLEFSDGKLLMGKYVDLAALGYDVIADNMGPDNFTQAVKQSRLIGMVNWTMLPRMETIWQQMLDVTLPMAGEERKLIFIDLADPAKRTDQDITGALNLVGQLNSRADVILGLNLSESSQVARVLGVPVAGDAESAIEKTAEALCQKLGIYSVVIHPRKNAAAAVKTAKGVQTGRFDGPFTSKPKLSTGAGDNFNAGFCLGQLAGLDVLQSVCCGTHTSGFYVRNAHSPSLTQLADFLDDPPPASD